jgi:cell division transport system permease protein
MQVSVLMKDSVPEEKAAAFAESLLDERYIKTATFISREQGEAELADLLGEDFVDIFETSPIPASVEITLDADYVSSDSLEVVKEEISKSPLVAEVNYQGSLVDALNANLNKISLILAFFIGLMLFISYVLINNTVRLNVYARRFTIHTMQLVGATRSFIRAPFLVQSAFQGVFSAFVAIMALIVILFFLRNGFEQLFEIFRLDLLLLVMGIVLVSGLVICVTSTYFVVNKLVSLKKAELYY